MKPSTELLVFRSRVDALLVALVIVPLAFVVGLVLWRTLARGDASSSAWVTLLVIGLSFAFVAWIFLDTSYRLTATEMFVRSGPVRVTVPLAQVRRVRRSNSLLSAPALSLRRLEVMYGKGQSVLISPADEERFFDALRTRAPGAEFETSGLA